MTTINTQDLTGPALDWAVAKCKGHDPFINKPYDGCSYTDGGRGFVRRYSTDWSQAGPIIEREKIGIDFLVHGFRGPVWYARIGGGDCMYGPTPLIAAMRCFVAARLGPTVDVPQELLP
jgi:hypothetical protein